MKKLVSALLVVVGLVNFLPVIGVLSAENVARAYGIDVPEGDLAILMRHRALLLGIVGALILSSAFLRYLQPAAMIAGLVSMMGFVVLAFTAGDYGDQIHSIVIADVVATVLLLVAIALRVGASRSNRRTSPVSKIET